jgi:hypothetical protein
MSQQMTHSQLTLRGLDRRLQREIRELARREGLSLNKAAVRLLEKGAGIRPADKAERIGSSLDHLIGTWTEDEADALLESIQSCEQVDRELWE